MKIEFAFTIFLQRGRRGAGTEGVKLEGIRGRWRGLGFAKLTPSHFRILTKSKERRERRRTKTNTRTRRRGKGRRRGREAFKKKYHCRISIKYIIVLLQV